MSDHPPLVAPQNARRAVSTEHRAEYTQRLLMVLPAYGGMSYRRACHEAALSGSAATWGLRRALIDGGLVEADDDGALVLTDAGRAERERAV